MTLTHYALTHAGVEFSLDDAPYTLSAVDALHLMHLILRDQVKLQFMLLGGQYEDASLADRDQALEFAVRMLKARREGETDHVQSH